MVNVDEITMSFGNLDNQVDLEVQSIEEEINFETSSQSAGTNNYNKLINKPSINSVVLIDNKTSQDLHVQPEGDYPDMALTNADIEELLDNFS